MRRVSHHLAATAIALVAACSGTATAQTVRPVYREIGDWLIACDNTRDCLARYAPDSTRERAEVEPENIGFDIVRKAGPSGAITVWTWAERRLDPAGFHASGAAPLSLLPWRLSDDGQDAKLSGDPARRFIRAIIAAPRLVLASTGTGHLSLRGLAAVLLAMDEAQGRVGNASALMRPGLAPAVATPPPAPLPVIRAGPPAPELKNPKALVAAVRKLRFGTFAAHECDREPDVEDAAYPLTTSDAIVVLGCSRYAYQTSVLVFRTPRDRPAAAMVLKLHDPPAAPPADSNSVGEYIDGAYDSETRTFREFAKGRGIADCGSATEWTFDGRAFRVSAFRWQARCGGTMPGDWPVLYRTRR
jgi:hypothetical protein